MQKHKKVKDESVIDFVIGCDEMVDMVDNESNMEQQKYS